MLNDPLLLAVMTLAVVILGLSKGGFAGIGMASTPMIAAITDPLTAAGLMLPILLVQDPLVVTIYCRSIDWRVMRRMLPGGAVRVLAAYVLATAVPEWTVKAVLGLVSVAFALWQFLVEWRGVPRIGGESRYDWRLGLAAGAASGFTSAVAHAGPPPFQIYVMPKQLAKEVYVGTSVMFFSAVNLMKLPSFIALGLFSAGTPKASALLIPLAIASSWRGPRWFGGSVRRAFAGSSTASCWWLASRFFGRPLPATGSVERLARWTRSLHQRRGEREQELMSGRGRDARTRIVSDCLIDLPQSAPGLISGNSPK